MISPFTRELTRLVVMFIIFVVGVVMGFIIAFAPSRSELAETNHQIREHIEEAKYNECKNLLKFSKFTGADDLVGCSEKLADVVIEIRKYNRQVEKAEGNPYIIKIIRYGTNYRSLRDDYGEINLRNELIQVREERIITDDNKDPMREGI